MFRHQRPARVGQRQLGVEIVPDDADRGAHLVVLDLRQERRLQTAAPDEANAQDEKR